MILPTSTDPVNEMWVDTRMIGQGGTGGLTVAGDDVEHAWWEPRLDGQLGDPKDRQGSLLGRLDHTAVAHRQCGGCGPSEDLQRVVPRDDVRGHPVWLPRRVDVDVLTEGDRRAVEGFDGTGVEVEIPRGEFGVAPRLLHGFPGLLRLQRPEGVEIAQNQSRQVAQQFGPRRGRSAAPRVQGRPLAARTAWSTSCGPQSAVVAMTPPVDGSNTATSTVVPTRSPFTMAPSCMAASLPWWYSLTWR